MRTASEVIAWAAEQVTDDDEWDAEFARQSSFVRASNGSASSVLYSTKLNPILRLFDDELPADLVLAGQQLELDGALNPDLHDERLR